MTPASGSPTLRRPPVGLPTRVRPADRRDAAGARAPDPHDRNAHYRGGPTTPVNVLVAGGSGFVGRALCRVLAARGHDVTAASRSPDPSVLPDSVATAAVDVTDDGIDGTVAGHDAVVNLVALPAHVQPERSHETVHAGGTRRLVAAAERAGLERFVQVSALGVGADVDTAYFRAKRRAERAVREAALEAVVYRPSVVFGESCAFVPFLERAVPPVVLPLPAGAGRLHPMWVGDLAPMLADGIDPGRAGSTYRLGGPEVLTVAETVQRIVGDRVVVPVPGAVAAAGAAVADVLPGVPVGRDQYRALRHDNVADPNDVSAFGAAADDLLSLGAYVDAR